MANKWWQEFEKSDGFRHAKLRFRQFIGKEPKFKIDVSINTKTYADWVIYPDIISAGDIVYSFGVCDNIDFDLSVIERNNVSVHAFDPTPYSIEWVNKQTLPPLFSFYPWAVANEDGMMFFYPREKRPGEKSDVMYTLNEDQGDSQNCLEVPSFTIESILKKLGHQKVDHIKMDIEGAEYDVLDGMLKTSIRPKQLLIEFHHRFKGIGKKKTMVAIKSLKANGYLIADISVTGREICFVHEQYIAGK